jgi:hypothetical protein
MKVFVALALSVVIFSVNAQEPAHGVVSHSADGVIQAWNEKKVQWSSIDEFWQDFASTSKSKYWGASTDYPNYAEVNEFDTFLVKSKQGNCLMQFFHSRWRRANDVQRWDDAFNQYSSCPYVFD